MRDDVILSGPGYAVFYMRDAGCFEIDGGNHLMTEKTPNNESLCDRNYNLRISGLPETYNQ